MWIQGQFVLISLEQTGQSIDSDLGSMQVILHLTAVTGSASRNSWSADNPAEILI